MSRVHLIHWNVAEARERAERLRKAGHDVAFEGPFGAQLLRELGVRPPHAVLIDLSRSPSHGRDVAIFLRQRKATRHVPLMFVNGDAGKVARLKELLPDAVYTDWGHVRGDLKRAIAAPPADPVVHRSLLAGYSGTPLPRKLGIRANAAVGVVGGPPGFQRTLGDLPDGVVLRNHSRGRCDLIIWFVRSRGELRRGIAKMAERLERGPIWIAWAKKGSPLAADLTQQHVRDVGLASGLVDYKVCAIDATWSGLLFTKRKPRNRRAEPGR
ncbi:MAG TPA: hypothetical protein VGK94_13240 [Candidatus Polarisedimenticolia bacterium]|jgi:CheY-like chemotaxis protein